MNTFSLWFLDARPSRCVLMACILLMVTLYVFCRCNADGVLPALPLSSGCACRLFGLAGLCLQALDWAGKWGKGYREVLPWFCIIFFSTVLFFSLFISSSLLFLSVLCVVYFGGLYLCNYMIYMIVTVSCHTCACMIYLKDIFKFVCVFFIHVGVWVRVE